MRKTTIIATLFLLFGSGLITAQDDMFKALFLFNFTKQIDWPDSYGQGDFVIGVLGNAPIVAELQKIAQAKKVGAQTIVVKVFPTAASINYCHLLFLPTAKSAELKAVLTQKGGKAMAVVTDKAGLAKEGAGINFVKVDGKQKYEINSKNLTGSGLKVSNTLTTLGIVVE